MTRRCDFLRPVVALMFPAGAISLSACGGLLGGPTAEVGECVQMETLQDPEVQDIPTVECTEEHDSTIALQDLSPTQEAWEADDRTVLCIGYLEGGTTTESFEDAKV